MASPPPRKKQRTMTRETVHVPSHRTFYTPHLKEIHQMRAKIALVVQKIEEQAALEEAFYNPSSHPHLYNLGSKHLSTKRTTFFSLPRELRQQILLQTYDFQILYRKPLFHTDHAKIIQTNDPRTELEEKCDWHELRRAHLGYVDYWLIVLKGVDPRLISDVNLVEKKWREGIDGTCDKYGGRR